MSVVGRLPWRKLPFYWGGQTIGAFLASSLAYGSTMVSFFSCPFNLHLLIISDGNFFFADMIHVNKKDNNNNNNNNDKYSDTNEQ